MKMRKTKAQGKLVRGVWSPLNAEWRSPNVAYKMSSHLSAGMPDEMKAALREAAARLSKTEGRRVSMSEVTRRLLAAGGLL